MKTSELLEIIKKITDKETELNENTPLVGGLSSIDSMSLVQICIYLEEKADIDGFEFDWTSEKAMSSINSVFKTPKTLTEEYNRQMRTT